MADKKSKCSHVSVVTNSWEDFHSKRRNTQCGLCKSGSQRDLWLCIHSDCLFIGCGESCPQDHSSQHVKDTGHCLTMSLATMRVWCHVCDSEIYLDKRNSPPVEIPKTNAERANLSHGDETESQKWSHAQPLMAKGQDAMGQATESCGPEYNHSAIGSEPRGQRLSGLTGLQNIGNSCYMNAALQALSNCPQLTYFFLDCPGFVRFERQPSLSKSYLNLIRDIWDKRRPGYVVPSTVAHGIKTLYPLFRGYAQQDTQEFLRCFMDRLHEELKQPVVSNDELALVHPTALPDRSKSNEDDSLSDYESCGTSMSGSTGSDKGASSGVQCSQPEKRSDVQMSMSDNELPANLPDSNKPAVVSDGGASADGEQSPIVAMPPPCPSASCQPSPSIGSTPDVVPSIEQRQQAEDATMVSGSVPNSRPVSPMDQSSDAGDQAFLHQLAAGDAVIAKSIDPSSDPSKASLPDVEATQADKSTDSTQCLQSSNTMDTGDSAIGDMSQDATDSVHVDMLASAESSPVIPDSVLSIEFGGNTSGGIGMTTGSATDNVSDGHSSHTEPTDRKPKLSGPNEAQESVAPHYQAPLELTPNKVEKPGTTSLPSPRREVSPTTKPLRQQFSDRGENKEKEKKAKARYRSIISDIYDGHLISSVQCLTCESVSTKKETFQDLSLPIPSRDHVHMIRGGHTGQANQSSGRSCGDVHLSQSWMNWMYSWFKSWFWGPTVTLQDCLSAFFSADELKGDNMYSCEKCKKLRNGMKYSKVLMLPEVLCIHLKRFRHDFSFSGKISSAVVFPINNLDMTPYVHKDCNTDYAKYRLVAVICHHGTAGGGHYTAYAINHITGTWYEFDDQYVTEVDVSQVESTEAYVLFYSKKNDQMPVIRGKVEERLQTEDTSFMQFYISKQWVNKFRTFANPGPISNGDFLCKHGGVSPRKVDHVDELAVPLPGAAWEYLHSVFGGGPACSHLFKCSPCQIELDAIHDRQEYEKNTFVKLHEEFRARGGDHTICAISMNWFKEFEIFVKGTTDECPGPIDNTDICVKRKSEGQPILNLNADFGQISLEMWSFLHDIYDGGPKLVVKQVD